MRLRLTISRLRKPSTIPLNYNYYLSTAVYRWIEASSPAYSSFLHDAGFPIEGTAKRFRHFCFSRLMVQNRRITDGRLQILSPTVDWYITMPVEVSLQHLVVGMFERRDFYIENEEDKFVVEQVETLPDPKWEKRMPFRMLSPVTVSTMHERNGRLLPEYLPANDSRLNDLLRQNILNKHRSLYGHRPDDTDFSCKLDDEFILRRGGAERISKLITIKQGREDETKVRGFMCPLTIEGNPALIALAYESGLGEKNSLGFGMLEAV